MIFEIFFYTVFLQSCHLIAEKTLKSVTYPPFPPRRPWQPCGCTLIQFSAEISLIREFSLLASKNVISAASRSTGIAVNLA